MITVRLFKKYMKNYKLFRTGVSSNSGKYYFPCSSCNFSTNNGKSENLYHYLHSKILACGPIAVAEYMKEVLTNPTLGYYMNKDVFGKQGDFITSPEITQLFGEMIAIWIIHEKQKISENTFQIVELGPGRGTLIKDILQVFKQFRLLNGVSIHLVEVSPALSLIQAKNLCKTFKEHAVETNESKENSVAYYREGVTEDDVKLFWYKSVQDVPKDFSVFLAHEFFDALPIHKFQKTERGWTEVLVDIIEGSNEEKFCYVLSNTPTPATVYIPDDEKREHVEISPESLVIIDYIANFLWEYGGFALICDYGYNGDKTDTFRGFSRHTVHDPLLRPGTADLTADVDFALLKKIAEKDDKLITFGPVTQASFLTNLGIHMRLKMLLQNVSQEERKSLESGYHMIMDEDKMGARFKVLSLFPSVLKEFLEKIPVAGFSK
ncbi:Protein arginine methyltransferase NDUFAF7, mitochondrial [Anthophora retusa]